MLAATLLGATLAAAHAAPSSDTVTLTNGVVSRTWTITAAGFSTTALRDVATAAQWARPGSPDFDVQIGPLTLTPVSGWSHVSVEQTDGEIVFDLTGPLVSLTYTVQAFPGSPTMRTDLTLTNHVPVDLPIQTAHLAELASPAAGTATVQAFNGGTDNLVQVRKVTTEQAGFDDEGEVLSVDAGGGAGWFFVTDRRGGLMSRVGRVADESWAGVDYADDLFDSGPINVPGTNDNRLANPLPLVPLREATATAGSTTDLGSAWVGVYHGGVAAAPAAFASAFDRYGLAPFARTIDVNTFHPFGHALTAASLKADAHAAAALGVQVFMLDDQWQGSSSGDWWFSAAKFPGATAANGETPDFVRLVTSLGMRLGLWMSPLSFNPNSATYQENPTWACLPTGDVSARIPDDAGLGVWDFTNPAVQNHLTQVVDRMIDTWHVAEFKFDYLTWLDCPPHSYLDAESAFVTWLRGIERAHPGVVFEIDETNDQRLWPFESLTLGPSWFDNDHSVAPTAPKQLHDLWSAAPWIPTSSLGLGALDGDVHAPYGVDMLMAIAVLSHFTFWTDLSKLNAAQTADVRWWTSWYRANANALGGLVYEDSTADPVDGTSFLALQPWDGDHGFLFVFRQASQSASTVVPLAGLDPAQGYVVTDVRTGAVVARATGRALAAGLRLTLPSPQSASVLSVDPVSG